MDRFQDHLRRLSVLVNRLLLHHPRIERIQIKARLKQDHCLSFYGHRLEWLAHTTLDLFRSERHTTQGLRQLFHQHGLACHESFQSEDGEEAVYLLKRTSA